MILKEWCNFTIDSGRSYVRESVIRIPDNECNSFPAVRMVVQSLLFTQESPIKIYLVDSEYGLITNYGMFEIISEGIKIMEIADGASLEQIKAATIGNLVI